MSVSYSSDGERGQIKIVLKSGGRLIVGHAKLEIIETTKTCEGTKIFGKMSAVIHDFCLKGYKPDFLSFQELEIPIRFNQLFEDLIIETYLNKAGTANEVFVEISNITAKFPESNKPISFKSENGDRRLTDFDFQAIVKERT
jgi:hypothetical protein